METVIFRANKRGEHRGDVTAVFPHFKANPGRMVCYAHLGQHGECAVEWYARDTRPATSTEYGPLLMELQNIYGPLRVARRRSRA